MARGRSGAVRALNERGEVLLAPIEAALAGELHMAAIDWRGDSLRFTVREPEPDFTEEDRSRQPTVFSALRAIVARFGAPDDARFGLYGAFGYDLAFQFDPIELRRPRPESDRDLVLYLPDAILVVDHQAATAEEHRFDFTTAGGRSTSALPRTGAETPWRAAETVGHEADHRLGEYAECVREAHGFFRREDLFGVVPGQSFFARCPASPSEVFRRLRIRNPAPYGALMNLGEGEYLVAASPEMYVRVDGRRIETCPISGTVARGADAIGDAEQILKLLTSEKEASELTMCTDVDRNDKSRVCELGSVRVIGRRQIEMYSRLIHTVDHVEGRLRYGFDALDGFLAHTWAVTVTSAPKLVAMQFIEDHEKSVRRWYGGAIGMIGFDGNMNTGLTLRTVHIRNGAAEVRAGATLLVDSDPEAEEEETRLENRKYNRAICVDGGVVVWRCGGGSVVVVRFVVGASADVSRWDGPSCRTACGGCRSFPPVPSTASARWVSAFRAPRQGIYLAIGAPRGGWGPSQRSAVQIFSFLRPISIDILKSPAATDLEQVRGLRRPARSERRRVGWPGRAGRRAA